ncbi:MAG TPA: serine/threonine-protein kinase [Thermoanaerobaculia bacterium]|nr:serine/threonine-protein kinase [Thermoanaerobaculia bacterium]
MTWLSDDAVARLRTIANEPDFSGTRYRLIGEIGRGGMGVVYEAEDLPLDRRVAVKVLAAELVAPGDAERIEREARIIARLEHPGIVPVHDVGTLADGRVFYAMKLGRGTRLDRWIAAEPHRTERLRVFLRICEAVAFAHANGVVHRDLKPENIMAGEFGAVLVMDWGLAKPSDASEPRGTIAGTPGFMAPEQSQGDSEAVDASTDVYALGAILDLIIRVGEGAVPSRLAAIARKARSELKSDRYAGVPELIDDVTRFLDGEPVAAYHENVFERIVRWLSRYSVLVAIIAAYLIMRAIVFLWLRR